MLRIRLGPGFFVICKKPFAELKEKYFHKHFPARQNHIFYLCKEFLRPCAAVSALHCGNVSRLENNCNNAGLPLFPRGFWGPYYFASKLQIYSLSYSGRNYSFFLFVNEEWYRGGERVRLWMQRSGFHLPLLITLCDVVGIFGKILQFCYLDRWTRLVHRWGLEEWSLMLEKEIWGFLKVGIKILDRLSTLSLPPILLISHYISTWSCYIAHGSFCEFTSICSFFPIFVQQIVYAAC